MPASAQVVTASVAADIKSKTGIELPGSAILIKQIYEPRIEVDWWFLRLDGTNPAHYPRQLTQLHTGTNTVPGAKLFERQSGASIGNPLESQFGNWQWQGLQSHATLITTTGAFSYLRIERFRVNSQGGNSRWVVQDQLANFATATRMVARDCGNEKALSPQLADSFLRNPGWPGWKGPYFEKLVKDPWGTPYQFKVEGNQLAIFSAGRDASAGTADDLATNIVLQAP